MSIVEGHSEVESVPVLVRRYKTDTGIHHVAVARPIRVKRNLVVKEGELERAVELARRLYPEGKALLLVLDADRDCPASLGPALLGRANSAAYGQFHCAVVLPKTELESWFVAAVVSLRGHRGICANAAPPADPERIGDAKHWLTRQMANRTYVEVDDQPAFAQLFDFSLALPNCRSFRKFDKELRAILLALSGPVTN